MVYFIKFGKIAIVIILLYLIFGGIFSYLFPAKESPKPKKTKKLQEEWDQDLGKSSDLAISGI